MLTSSSNHPRSFLMTTVLSVARSRVTRGPAYGAVTPKLMMPSSFRVQFSREASDAAASASMARVRTRMSAAAPIAPVAAHSRRRWVRAGLRPQQSRQAPVFAATAAPSRARWGRNVFFASAGIGCAIGVIGAATSPASPAGAWFFSSPPTGATSVIVALQAVAAAAQMVAELGAVVLASVAARGSDVGRWVGLGSAGSRTHADGSGGDPQLWWLAGDKADDSALLGWLSSGTERAGSVAARLERFGAWCVGRRTVHQEEAGDAIPMLAMFTAPLFMLLYALLCCF